MLIRSEIAHRDKFEISAGVHRFNSLVILLNGEFEYSVGDVTKKVLPITPIMFRQGVSFKKRVIRPIDFIIVSFSKLICEVESFIELDKSTTFRVLDSVERLKNAIINNEVDTVTEHFANDILLTSKPYTTIKKEEILPAYKYITENFTKSIPLTTLSMVDNCSVQSLINRFKKLYGKTPARCIAELRIKKAKELLSKTKLSVGQIAEECGYENVYYFSNAFKKEIGMSPMKYRQSTLM